MMEKTLLRVRSWMGPHRILGWLICWVLVGIPFVAVVSAQESPTVVDVMNKPSETEEPPKPPSEEAPQEGAPVKTVVEFAIPGDQFQRGVPRSSVMGFFDATNAGDFVSAAEYLDFRNLPGAVQKIPKAELARQLYVILERGLWVDMEKLSTDPGGHPDDGLPLYQDRLGIIKESGKTYELLLQHVPFENKTFIWKISNQTVTLIPELYDIFGHAWLDTLLPPWVFDTKMIGLFVWEWVALVLVGLAAYLTALVFTRLLVVFFRQKKTSFAQQLVGFFHGPAVFLLFAILTNYWMGLLRPSATLNAFLHARTILLTSIAIVLVRLVDLTTTRLIEAYDLRGRAEIKVLLPPVANGMKFLFILILLLLWLDNMGFQVTTVVAGLGIGGLAVALAAQKSIENLIGAIVLYSAQPVRVGDFCRFGNFLGTVEEIGLTSTRVRTLEDTVVAVPNVEFAYLHLDNYSRRRKIRFHPRICLRYDTTPDQVRYILIEIRKLLLSHPKVLQDPARIRLADFGEYSLNLDIFAYIDVQDYGEFLEVAEDLHLRIMDIVQQQGAGFAVPSQTIYLEHGRGVNEEQAKAAEGKIKSWKEQRALYLPNFPAEEMAKLKSSLDYPPLGSPEAVVAK